MIDGIQIINETVKSTGTGGTIVLGIFLLAMAIILFLLAIEAYKMEEIAPCIVIFFVSLILGFGSFVSFYSYNNGTEYKEYQVTINDTVKFNEFHNKYYIESRNGNIYTITEKNVTQ